MIQGLTNRKFEPAVFKSMSECGICMVEYTESDEITPLPCNVNHYFHSECFKTWLNEKQECPLCRTQIDATKLEEFAGKLD